MAKLSNMAEPRRKKKRPMTNSNSISTNGIKIQEFSANSLKVKPERSERAKKYQGRKPVDPKLIKKYSKGEGVSIKDLKGKKKLHYQYKLQRKEIAIQKAEEEASRAEILLPEASGQLEAQEGTYSSHITQKAIREAVDITTASKSFDLNLKEFGPYKFRFTQNGRHMVLGGRKGHLASFDWVTKKLHTEINVMESIHDVCWLHTEQMFAAAQKKWVYIYDNQGIELHCLKKLDRVLKLEFLPYHFLLCAGHETGFISWLDITLGTEVTQFPTRKGRLEVMCQNPSNAVLCCGHSNGTVSMWTPNCKQEVASVLCHPHPVQALEIDPTGRYMATAGADRMINIWDARNLGTMLNQYRLRSSANNLSFSQTGLLSVAMGNVVEVYNKVIDGCTGQAYMRYKTHTPITDIHFSPYEDVLGVSSFTGYSSLIIPGSGEPNFDALEANPYMSTSGRREAEVKSLLSKVPSTLITLDPNTVGQVDTPTLEEKIEAKSKLVNIKVPNFDVRPRYRMKGKSGSAQKFKRKQKKVETLKRDYLKSAVVQRKQLGLNKEKKKKKKSSQKQTEVLDRFKSKIKAS